MAKDELVDFALWIIQEKNTECMDWDDAKKCVEEYLKGRLDIDVYQLKDGLENITKKYASSGSVTFRIKLPSYEKEEKRNYFYIEIEAEPFELGNEYFDYGKWFEDVKKDITDVLTKNNLELSVLPLQVGSGETEVIIKEVKSG